MQRCNNVLPLRPLVALECRAAFTLVEMVVVIALTSILLSTVATMIYSLNRWDQSLRERYIGRDQSLRLAAVVRKDIRGAKDVMLTENGKLEVTSPTGGVTRYELMPEGCRREQIRAGEEKPRIDFFAVGNSAPMKLDLEERHGQSLVKVMLPLIDASDRPMSRAPLVISAVLSKDLLTTTESAEEN